MAIDLLKIKPWGPPVLREIVGELQDAINERTPIKGLGVTLNETETGFQISTTSNQPIATGLNIASDSGGGLTPAPSGAYTVIATEFVSVSNAGTAGDEILYSHEIGANRLAKNGDSIRATYALNVSSDDSLDVLVRFGRENLDSEVVADGQGLDAPFNTYVKVEVLIMRVSATFYRVNSVITGTSYPVDASDITNFLLVNGPGLFDQSRDLSPNLFLTLWGGATGVGQVTANLALIEYVPA